MSVLDAFSTLSSDHPLHQPGDSQYVIAPPLNGDLKAISAFRIEYRSHSRVAGGLYPVLLLDNGHMVRELADDWWCGLVLREEAAGASLADGLESGLLSHPTAADLPLVIDCGYAGFSHPEHLIPFMKALPPRPVMLTHGGQLNVSGLHLDAAEMLFKTYEYTVLETSGIYRQDFLERMIAELGHTRILYGSGHPLMDERLEIERIRFLPVDGAQKNAILGQNARHVFKL